MLDLPSFRTRVARSPVRGTETFVDLVTIELSGHEGSGASFDCEVEFTREPIVPAHSYGDPSDCFPFEDGDVKIPAVRPYKCNTIRRDRPQRHDARRRVERRMISAAGLKPRGSASVAAEDSYQVVVRCGARSGVPGWLVERSTPAVDSLQCVTSDLAELPPWLGPAFREEFQELFAVADRNGSINSRRLGRWLSANKDRIKEGVRFRHVGARSGAAIWTAQRGE